MASATRHHCGGRCGGEKSMRAQARARSVTSGEAAMAPGYGTGEAPPDQPRGGIGGGPSSLRCNGRLPVDCITAASTIWMSGG